MKRTVTILVILGVILTASIGSLFYLGHVNHTLSQELEAACDSAEQGDFSSAKEHSATAVRQWEHYESLLSLFLRHNDLDELTTTIAKLPELSEQKDAALFCSEADKAAALMKHIYDSELPTLKNFF